MRDGYVLIDKPAGVTSHDAVQAVRRAFGFRGRRGRKAGHAGTLDPFATGVLVVLVGAATRLMPWVVGCDKRYQVDVRFGAGSSTDDRTGDLVADPSPRPGRDAVVAALATVGSRPDQVPPQVSAIHVDGERAWRRVRRGEIVAVPSRPVRFDALELLAWACDGEDVVARLNVRCSSGTYMRSLARDLGLQVGCAAHVEALHRGAVGAWTDGDTVALEALAASDVRPAAELVPRLARVRLDSGAVHAFRTGARVPWLSGNLAPAQPVAALDERGDLVAIAHEHDGSLQPRTVLPEAAG